MVDASLPAFLLAMLLLTLVPGADTLLVIRNTLTGGSGKGDLTALGVCCGLFVHAGLSALGISFILMQSASLFSMVKTLGALYLIWLGCKSLRRAAGSQDSFFSAPAGQNTETTSRIKAFREGFLSNVLNPKTAVFYMAFLPQFIHPQDPAVLKSFFLASLHFMMALTWLCLVAHGLQCLRYWLTNPAIRRWLEGISGGILVAFGIRLGLIKTLS
ncbi:LysE family translocator [Desulfobotulus sp. H1]|uniref:LysE family translocator n=1 Tax=Desulfobotulus pelophilus TaxID=2823377 RepID=A0ABT3N6B8_9BACT|nr:LysE family translocator [Desulfobotulus pelophilus]MCW7752701.1 LysE family translocator [Desulfobotulus pelophilus]